MDCILRLKDTLPEKFAADRYPTKHTRSNQIPRTSVVFAESVPGPCPRGKGRNPFLVEPAVAQSSPPAEIDRVTFGYGDVDSRV
jgi:hypothetical protein